MTLGEKISEFSKTYKMSAIARRAGISRSSLHKYQYSGTMPPADKALSLAKELGVSLDWLIDEGTAWPPVWRDQGKKHLHKDTAA